MPRKTGESLLMQLPTYVSHAIPVHVACAHPIRFSCTRLVHISCGSHANDSCDSSTLLEHPNLPPDDSSLCLSIEMVEISRMETRVFSLDCKERMARHGTLTPKEVFISFLLTLYDLSPP